MNALPNVSLALVTWMALASPASGQMAESALGQRVFRTCTACHSLEPDRNMTGPSLSGVWGRKAGGLSSFTRYSRAMKSADVTWNEETLDRYLENPRQYIPGNTMTFPGIKDAKQRSDLLAFLKSASQPGGDARMAQRQGDGMGMMGGGQVPNLKQLTPARRVRTIRLCGDTYQVTTADGDMRDFWERNLRFKTDSSGEGPEKGAPAILAAGMMGDRASVIFASPDEISSFITKSC